MILIKLLNVYPPRWVLPLTLPLPVPSSSKLNTFFLPPLILTLKVSRWQSKLFVTTLLLYEELLQNYVVEYSTSFPLQPNQWMGKTNLKDNEFPWRTNMSVIFHSNHFCYIEFVISLAMNIKMGGAPQLLWMAHVQHVTTQMQVCLKCTNIST